MMDRWKVTTTQDDERSNVPACTMTNYFGIGLDAHIALGFHEKREAHPEQFKSRLRNKAHYVQIGTAAMLSHPCKGFGKNLEFEGYVEANNAWQAVDTKGYEGMVRWLGRVSGPSVFGVLVFRYGWVRVGGSVDEWVPVGVRGPYAIR